MSSVKSRKKPILIEVGKEGRQQLIVRNRPVSYFESSFHFHPQFELVYIINGSGKRLVGDCMEEFSPGDLVFLSPNIPHSWQGEMEYFNEEDRASSSAIEVYFSKELFQTSFGELEEARVLTELFSRAEKGLKIKGAARDEIAGLLTRLVSSKGLEKIVLLLHILACMADAPETEQLISDTYKNWYDATDNSRMEQVLLYVNTHFRKPVTMPEVAALCQMTPESFCRFFKARTKKRFIDFLNDIRIAHARKQMTGSDDLTIGEIAYHSGFENISHFNRLFKIKTGITPSEFRKGIRRRYEYGIAV